MVFHNITAQQMRDVFEWLCVQDHSLFDSFVCCLFSHGVDGALRGSDWELVGVEELAQSMNGRRCSTLDRKPKMFFIQACRGSFKGKEEVVSGLQPSVNVAMEPAFGLQWGISGDFFFGYSTPPGYSSWRYEELGSRYIMELCQELCTSSISSHLADMHIAVQEVVSRQYKDRAIKAMKMQPTSVSTLTGLVFFFPA